VTVSVAVPVAFDASAGTSAAPLSDEVYFVLVAALETATT
jgi:hypothetical protein